MSRALRNASAAAGSSAMASNITGSTAAIRASRISSQHSASEAQGDPPGAPGGARWARHSDPAGERNRRVRMGRDVVLLPGHRLTKVGPAVSHSRVLRTCRRTDGRCGRAVPRVPRLPSDCRSAQLRRRGTLYGRYWGCTEEVPFLHFELCFYQAVEWAIEHGLSSAQAGAQGEHKVSRGYEPVITKSAHFIPNRSFRNAVADFVMPSARASRPRSNGCAANCLIAILRRRRSPRTGRFRRPCLGTWPGS